uniref:FLYWCH-type domain-containing protein n=1 Tax=Globodera rostochiensis TaxID=31243 RepID=A0A914HAE4_GLORO
MMNNTRALLVKATNHRQDIGDAEKLEEEYTDEPTTMVDFSVGKTRKAEGQAIWKGFRFVLNRTKGSKKFWVCANLRKTKYQVKVHTSVDDISRGTILPSKDSNAHNHLPNPAGVEAEQSQLETGCPKFLIYDSDTVRPANFNFPAVHCLMGRGTENNYRTTVQYMEVLTALKEHLGEGNGPLTIMTDFESALMPSLKNSFNPAENKACLFHLGQAFFTRFKKLKLVRHYGVEEVRRSFRWLISLAFLPQQLVRKGFGIIINQSFNGMEEFLYYVGKNYVCLSRWEVEQKQDAFLPNADAERLDARAAAVHSTPNFSGNSDNVRGLLSLSRISNVSSLEALIQAIVRQLVTVQDQAPSRFGLPIARPPKFPISLWNVRDRVESELPRCQASMEANHLALQKQSKRRPRMLDFLASLHKFDSQKTQEAREALLQPGSISRRPEYVQMDKTIKHLVKNAPLHTDEDIKALEAISLALHRGGIVANMTASGEVREDEEQDEEWSPQFDYPPYYSFYENSGHDY